MHQDNLRFLYREYKNCLKNEFSNNFSKDDEYKSYYGRCFTQQSDIRKYFIDNYRKITNASFVREDEEIANKYEVHYTKFGKYGWNAAQIKNYFLNIDRSKEEHDVWVNHIMAAHSEADWGMYDISQDESNYIKDFKKSYYNLDLSPSYVNSYKWTGKATDDWNRVDNFIRPRVIG